MPFIGDNGNKTKTPNAGAAGLDKPLIKSVQQAASDAPKAPKFLSTYTLKLNNGSTYELTQSQVDWIKNRYQSTVAEAKDYDFGKTYRDTTLDKKLLSAGLPSEKYIEKFISAYSDWYGDGQSYNFDGGMKNTIANKFKSDWEYEYTNEDKKRKAAGQMPLAIEAKYGDNRRDYELMQAGLPPESMLSDYVGAYQTIQTETKRKDEFYFAVTKLALANSANPYKVDDATKQAAFDAVISSSEWEDVAALYDEPPKISDDGTVDTIEEYQKKWSAQKKAQKSSDEPTVSYADFSTQFLPYKSRVMKEDTATRNSVVAAQTKKTSEVVSNATAKEYIGIRKEEDPATVFAEMYESGVPLTQINNAKKHWKTLTSDAAKDKAIEAAFATVQAQYNADRARVATPIEDQYSASANAGRYSKENIAAYQADQKAIRQAKRFGDKAIKNGVVKDYDQGATSTIDADDAEKIFKSHLVYDEKGKPTKESIALATNMMYEAGATTPIVLEVGKRAGMKSGIFSQDYADKQKETLQDSMMGAYEAQVSGTEPVAEQKSPNDLTAFNSAFSDVVAERDLAQRKELTDAAYKANVESGNMTSADFYNAVRRAGWGDTIDVSKDAESYYKEVYAPKFEKNGEQLKKWEEIDQAAFIENFESGKDLNPDIHKTPEELTKGYLSRAFTAGIFEVISGTVGFVDMATAKMSGRTELWEFTKRANEATAASQGVSSNQSAGAQIGGLAATISEQLIRMYTVSQIGSGVLSMFSNGASALAGAASNTNAGNLLSTIISNSAAANKGAAWLVNASKQIIKSSPFITNAMGSYYSEAMANDATVEQATAYGVIGGLIEGATEAIGAELWIGRAIGSQAAAKGLIKSALKGTLKGSSIATKAVLINLVASSLGNGLEEMASYAGTWLVKRETYDKDAQFSLAEMWDNGKMGMLVGLFGAGLGMAEDTNANTIAKFLSTKRGMEWASNEGIGSIHDLFIDSVIADSQTEQLKRAVVYQDSVESSEERKATWNDIEAMTRQLDEGQVKFDKDIAKIDAELAKKQNAVTLLTTNLEQAASDKSAAGMKKWSKIAAQLQVAQEELQVEQKQADQKRTETIKAHNESVAQQTIALEKAQARYVAHSIGMTIAFENEIKALKSMNPDMAVLGKQILSKMDAARAGKLKDYIKAYNDALTTSPAQPAGDAQTVQAPTVQPTTENAPTGAEMASDMHNAATESAGNIKSEATPANPAETMGKKSEPVFGIVDPRLQQTVDTVRRAAKTAYKFGVTDTMGLEKFAAVQAAQSKKGAVDSADLSQWVRNSSGRSQYLLNNALVSRDGVVLDESYNKVYVDDIAPEDRAEFNLFRLAKQNSARMRLEENGYGENKPVLASETEVDKDGNPAPMSATESDALAAKIEAAHPDFTQKLERQKAWWKKFGQSYMVDSGLWTQETFDALNQKYPDYVPTYRVDKKVGMSAGSVRPNSIVAPSVIRAAKGSLDEIVNPTLSFAKLVERYVSMESIARLAQNDYAFAEKNPEAIRDMIAIYDEESGQTIGGDVDFVSFDEIANENATEVKDGKYIVRSWKDGKKIAMSVNKDIFDAYKSLLHPQDLSLQFEVLNKGLKISRSITKPIKAVITGINPAFGIRNPIMDSMTYFMFTEANALHTYTNVFEYIGRRASNDRMWKEYLFDTGKGQAGFVTGQFIPEEVMVTDGKVKAGVKKAARVAGRALSFTGEVTENSFRFAEYREGRRKYGDSPDARLKAAQMAADITVNFSRSGAATKAADAVVMYLNANVQGVDKLARTVAARPIKTIARGMTLAAMITALRYIFRNDENPHYDNLPNYVKDANILVPNVFGERDENGYCTTFIKLPKGRQLAMALIATTERFARMFDGEPAESAFADLGENIIDNFAVQLNPFWQPLTAAKTNKNWYGGDIVPRYMKDNEAAPDQTTAQNTWVADAISERLYEITGGKSKVSPMHIDYMINQLGGNFFGKIVTGATAKDSSGFIDAAGNVVKDMFVVDPLYQSGVVNRFYDAETEAQYAARESRIQREELNIGTKSKDEVAFERFQDYKDKMAELRKREREILATELDTPERKAKIDAIREEINKWAAEGIAAWNGR